MQRSVILSSFVLLAAGLIQFACVQDFDQFDPGKATGGAGGETATSSSSSSGTPGSGGGTSSSSSSSTSSSSSASSATSSSSSSGGMPCMKKPDCGQDDACTTWACTGGMCVPTYADMTKVVSGGTDGDCKATVCNGAGATFETNYDMDTPPSDGNDCTLEICNNGMPVKDLAQTGSTCEVNRKCDMNGTCVDCIVDGDCGAAAQTCFNGTCVSCNDNMKNGDETGVDCGGSCKKCNGTTCGNASECESGNCVDTVCCNEACGGDCKSCNLAGSPGMCMNIPLNGTDTMPVCGGTQVCNGNGACKLKLGEICVNDGDCASGKCTMVMGDKICVVP